MASSYADGYQIVTNSDSTKWLYKDTLEEYIQPIAPQCWKKGHPIMCKWGEFEELELEIPADMSHTGESYIKRVKIDKCIAPIVKALNDAGIKTRASCCGHGLRNPKIVLFDNMEEIEISFHGEDNE